MREPDAKVNVLQRSLVGISYKKMERRLRNDRVNPQICRFVNRAIRDLGFSVHEALRQQMQKP